MRRNALELTKEQVRLQEEMKALLRVFSSREWNCPGFPWPLVVSPRGAGVSTALRSVAQGLGIGYMEVFASQWVCVGARAGHWTVQEIAKWAAQKPKGILVLGRLEGISTQHFDNSAWYMAACSEMIALLSGLGFPGILEGEDLMAFRSNVFSIGTGTWRTTEANGKTVPVIREEDAFIESHEISRHTTPESLLVQFAERPFVMGPPDIEDWVGILKGLAPDCNAQDLAGRAMESRRGLHAAGDILVAHAQDRGCPGQPPKVVKEANPGAVRDTLDKISGLCIDFMDQAPYDVCVVREAIGELRGAAPFMPLHRLLQSEAALRLRQSFWMLRKGLAPEKRSKLEAGLTEEFQDLLEWADWVPARAFRDRGVIRGVEALKGTANVVWATADENVGLISAIDCALQAFGGLTPSEMSLRPEAARLREEIAAYCVRRKGEAGSLFCILGHLSPSLRTALGVEEGWPEKEGIFEPAEARGRQQNPSS